MNELDIKAIIELARLPLWKKLKHKTILITGATGMLGGYIALAAARANREYNYGINLVLMGRNKEKAKNLFKGIDVRFLFQDVRDPIDYDGMFHYIIHTAGPVGPNVFRENPLDVLSTNIEGTLSLLRHAKKYGCEGFVLASTHEVYGTSIGEKTETSPISMPDTMKSRTCYILAKQSAENALACFAAQNGIRVMSARLSRLYGPLMNINSGLFICDFLQQAMSTQHIRLHSGANVLRPLCHIQDAAAAMLYILLNGESINVYNVQGKELPTISEIAKLIAHKLETSVILDMPETASMTPEGQWLSTKKLEDIGWRQQVSLENGIEQLCTAIQNQKL